MQKKEERRNTEENKSGEERKKKERGRAWTRRHEEGPENGGGGKRKKDEKRTQRVHLVSRIFLDDFLRHGIAQSKVGIYYTKVQVPLKIAGTGRTPGDTETPVHPANGVTTFVHLNSACFFVCLSACSI